MSRVGVIYLSDMGVTLDMLSSHNTHPKATRLEPLLDECDRHIDQLHQGYFMLKG